MDRIVIDQAKIQIDDSLKVKPGSEFPRPLDWWQRIVPCWLDASEDEHGHIVITPNGHRADGHVYELTPAVIRREMKAAMRFLGERRFLDFTDAIVTA
ncbi:hypothetical protein [Streptomyces sparsogenes]|uniref:Uncharacterized protein n=1 Tax=Streptomyces sparsogenes DSM 40356 TaxID=1331668 RepID=A0A1R1S873_9ACTN|nr:hypothetical protein [Streptomyces sparsogenes]OMI34437.1 hypothetical protein SPAR_36676 [Streptomyces sparsogenes DSM 40356]